jgi:glycosyltransferase involved in cell wall biosynthesis
MDSLYRSADVVVLTSHSEGIPLVLMEAMARGVIVLAPAITGIPELIEHGKSGFLYSPGKLDDLVQRLVFLYAAMHGAGPTSGNSLDQIRHAAQLKILQDFSREENLTRFAEMFLHLVAPHDWSSPHEDPLLQQI